MLKIDPKFGIYALSVSKAVKGMLKAHFISLSDDERFDILDKACAVKRHKGAQNIVEWRDIANKVLEVKSLKYYPVTLHTAPAPAPVHSEGFPRPAETGFPTAGFPMTKGFPGVTATCFPASSKVDKTIYYDVDGVDYPMSLDGIYKRFNQFHDTFVAVCRKGAGGKLELTGFVYKDNTDLR